MRKFDPHNVPKMLHFIEHLVFEYSKLTEHYKVDIDGIQTSFRSQNQFIQKQKSSERALEISGK